MPVITFETGMVERHFRFSWMGLFKDVTQEHTMAVLAFTLPTMAMDPLFIMVRISS